MAFSTRNRSRDEAVFDPRPPLPPDATPGQRWRFRRNLVIYIAARSGLSQRLLADVFDLRRSRIGEIIDDFEDLLSLNSPNEKQVRAERRSASARD
jgi:hypothetical protein